MSYETPQVSAELVNAAFLQKLDSGMLKEAQEAGSAYIRQKLYEEGILRRLFEPRPLTADELDPEEFQSTPPRRGRPLLLNRLDLLRNFRCFCEPLLGSTRSTC